MYMRKTLSTKVKRPKLMLLLLLLLPLSLPLERLRRETLINGNWASPMTRLTLNRSGKFTSKTKWQPKFFGRYRFVGLFQIELTTSYYIENYGAKKNATAFFNGNANSYQSIYNPSREDNIVSVDRFWINWNGSKLWLSPKEGEEYIEYDKCGGIYGSCN